MLVRQREHTTPRAWEREHTLAAHRQHTLSRGSTFSSRLISIFLGGGRSNERGRISGAQHVMTLARHAGSSAHHVHVHVHVPCCGMPQPRKPLNGGEKWLC